MSEKKFFPLNGMFLVEVPEKQQEDRGFVLPTGVKTKDEEQRYRMVKLLDISVDERMPMDILLTYMWFKEKTKSGFDIFLLVEGTMLEEFKYEGKTYNFVHYKHIVSFVCDPSIFDETFETRVKEQLSAFMNKKGPGQGTPFN